MVDSRFHGLTTREFTNVPRAVEFIDLSYIGLIGTAPDADETNWPLNEPVLITGQSSLPEGLGLSGTIPDALDAIWDQANATIVVVRVEEVLDEGELDVTATMWNILGNRLQLTGAHALRKSESMFSIVPRILIASGFTAVRPTDGVASVTISAGGSGYDRENPPAITTTGGSGAGFSARAVVSVAGVVTAIIIENPGAGYSEAPTIAIAAPEDGDTATATATLGTVANPVGKELEAIAGPMRAMVVVDGPNTTNAAAVLARQDYGTDRVMIVDPWCKIAKDGAIVTDPPSARLAGLQVRVDQQRGFWHSPSNKQVLGILGTARPISHGWSDPNTDAEYLNDNEVSTIIRDRSSGGFLFWGNRTTSGDSVTAFWSVRRTSDVIVESVELACRAFVDEPFSIDLLKNIGETASAGLRRLVARGATIGSRVWLDPAYNTPESFLIGEVYVSYDAEPAAPAEHIIFHYHRNTGYYTELARNAARELERLAL
ncbi:phage tail sheath subtilisin-like domain-containing protein [Acuticoccus sp. M5D2P5]|uniref:phage tail sheath subtilisin-like domain-containing protein n=1 Tax=Acuticoccus kalidii TaxID=2910977 RepID=UPI001F268FF9|nr:phage tail sheath subtilisin-like domain-containing protein [Acuticoccus kalidii]MCF3934999.1 phage tail sheath subtilisin-like domain-containing protein [Acuticoccus kalidii]